MRMIDTDAGRLVGKVDRVARRVVWALECPDCGELITLDEEAFTGRRASMCGCGWKTQPVGVKDQSDEDGIIHVYFDFASLAFNDSPSGVEAGIERGMRL